MKRKIIEGDGYEIDHIVIAKYFGMTTENFKVAKQKWKAGKKSQWTLYCDAYQMRKLKKTWEKS